MKLYELDLHLQKRISKKFGEDEFLDDWYGKSINGLNKRMVCREEFELFFDIPESITKLTLEIHNEPSKNRHKFRYFKGAFFFDSYNIQIYGNKKYLKPRAMWNWLAYLLKDEVNLVYNIPYYVEAVYE